MNTNDIKPARRIVCAANRDPGINLLLLGPRHWDATMRSQYQIIDGLYDLEERVTPMFEEQGFIDQHGIFLSRQEAWKVAEAAGQIIQRVGGDESDGGTLYSENLY